MQPTRRAAVATLALGLPAAKTAAAWAQTAAPATSWRLADLYADAAAWDAARRAVQARLPELDRYRGRLGTDAATLAAALTLRSDLSRQTARVVTYASLAADADHRDPRAQGRATQADDLQTALDAAGAWMEPEILAVGDAKVAAFVAADPTLRSRFDFHLADVLRRRDHTLSAEGEALLAGAAGPLSAFGDIHSQLISSDIPWPTITLSTGRAVRLDDQGLNLNRAAPDRNDRKRMFDAYWAEHAKFTGTIGVNYLAHLRDDAFQSRARRYPSALARTLDANKIPESVYRTLVAETNQGLPQLHRYFDLRRRLLKLPELGYWDLAVPLVTSGRRFTLPEMRTLTLEATAPLGPDYVRVLGKATASGWMDPLPRPGKQSGGYMNPGAAYDVHPYLLMNLGDDYASLSTFAHEWGHAMHTLVANAAQPYDKAQYTIFTAEIPSTCNELLLASYMASQARTKEDRLFYLGMQLENLRGTYYRQVMLADFELAVHDRVDKGEALSGAEFTSIFLEIMKRYHGPGVVIADDYAVNWANIPHFYNSFYVYQYATCIAAAAYFARSILTGGARERDAYFSVLRAGGADHPVEVLRRAGLDMTSPAPYRAVNDLLKTTLDQCDALLA